MGASNSKYRIVIYLVIGLVWTMLWLISYIATAQETFGVRVLNEIWRSIYIIGLNFLLYEMALPYLKKKTVLQRILIGFPFLIVLLTLASIGIIAWRELGLLTGIYTSLRPAEETFFEALGFHTPSAITSFIFFGLGLHLFNYIQLQRMAQRLRIENQAAELAFLKAQTNPHFLFNTLNNIFSLAKDKAPAAADSILRLSGIMRFMLYNSSLPSVSVKQEIELLNDYLELEKLRYDESFRMKFSFKVENMEQQLPPLLLIPLVENAFKHGASQSTEDAFVDIDLKITTTQLCFTVVNPIPEEQQSIDIRENIGLTNLRRQLGLLYSEYELKLERSDMKFHANLTINLLSDVRVQLHNN